nr:AAA family ATPase [Otoolea muris]
MGLYLNSRKPQNNYREIVRSDYFVDKTGLLGELIPIVGPGEKTSAFCMGTGQSNKYICITRPRRFGKTIAANMVAAYFGKGYNGHDISDGLAIGANPEYEKHLNGHNVIHITFSEMPGDCCSYRQYIDRIQDRLLKDLISEYPRARIDEADALWDIL